MNTDNHWSISDLQRQAIEDAGYHIISAEPGKPIMVVEIAKHPQLPDIHDVLKEMVELIPQPIYRPKMNKQKAHIQPWRLKEEEARIARMKARIK